MNLQNIGTRMDISTEQPYSHFVVKLKGPSKLQTDDLNAKITDFVRASWERGGKPLLLSQLGNEDNGTIARLARDFAGGLERYLQTQLSDTITIIHHTDNPKVKFALPIDVNADDFGGWDSLIETFLVEKSKVTLRFFPAFWAAFRKFLTPSKKRYLHIEHPIWFKDSSTEEINSDLVEIDPQYVSLPEAPDSDVTANIFRWLEDKDFPAQKFTLDDQQPIRKSDTRNLLDEIFVSLENDELRRLSIPMDVAKKLKNITI